VANKLQQRKFRSFPLYKIVGSLCFEVYYVANNERVEVCFEIG
jgi:hypothetical protein